MFLGIDKNVSQADPREFNGFNSSPPNETVVILNSIGYTCSRAQLCMVFEVAYGLVICNGFSRELVILIDRSKEETVSLEVFFEKKKGGDKHLPVLQEQSNSHVALEEVSSQSHSGARVSST